MFSNTLLPAILTALMLLSTPTVARYTMLERDGRAVFLRPRRFGQENPDVIGKLRDACPGQVCGTLAGKAITPLLAAQPECSQQDLADEIIDASKQFDAATQANMLAIAIEYRQSEKNTPPDFTTNPPTLRNSVFCQKAPKNAALNGLVQAQDPANDPNIFFDPALKASVKKGSQANTAPFNGAVAAAPAAAPAVVAASSSVVAAQCPAPKVVFVTKAADAAVAIQTVAAAPAAAGGNLQAFAAALGGVTAPTVIDLGGGRFQVTGNAVFNNLQSALIRSCDVQNNQCANKANSGAKVDGLSVGACNAQQATCIAQARASA